MASRSRLVIGVYAAALIVAVAAALWFGGGAGSEQAGQPDRSPARVPPPPTTKGADTLLNFTFRLDTRTAGIRRALLACKDGEPLSGSKGLVFSNLGQAQRACAKGLDNLKAGDHSCPEGEVTRDSTFPWVKVEGARRGEPFEAVYALGDCANSRKQWMKASALWRWSTATMPTTRLLVPVPAGEKPDMRRLSRWGETQFGLCVNSMPDEPLKPCFEQGKYPAGAPARGVIVTQADIRRLRGADQETVLEVLRTAESISLTAQPAARNRDSGLLPSVPTTPGRSTGKTKERDELRVSKRGGAQAPTLGPVTGAGARLKTNDPAKSPQPDPPSRPRIDAQMAAPPDPPTGR